ncbi:GNAT family N-acetyltransferase [Actinoplanes aureus]|uniref:GNAT family N-acetyltransferase n=1 Tax=Actinoplanes aureus TaxID=2792083 RepID=A0A931G3P7_9ACTN|nr:GNAT family N-acetyltransferase [Actinoplanes aureus]MBG0567196.1 GNAT family N-acetyltransferase [Actinoplanes aureus]
MSAPEITVATTADRTGIVESLVAAFRNDPVLRFLFPDEETYPAHAAAFFGHLFDKRVGRQSIWTIGGAAVAIWEPPVGTAAVTSHVAEPDLPPDAVARLKDYDHAVHSALPDSPFWYLGVLGTDPASAGRGWGRAVMAAGLNRAAADGLPAILETSTPGNVEFYRRAGWRVVGELTAPLPIWIMQQ